MNAPEQARNSEMEKLGFRLSGFRQWPLEKTLAALAQIGYRSVELCLEHPELNPESLDADAIARIKQLLDRLGLRVSAVSYHGRKDSVAAALKKQKLGLKLAREFGTRVLVVGSVDGRHDPQGGSTYRALEELVREADGTEVVVAVEPEPDTVIHGMYEFSMLARDLSGCPLGLNLDLGHAYLTEGNATQVVDEWAPFIVHVHLGDVRKPNHVHLMPGDGHLDLRGSVQRLRECGYEGDLTVDFCDLQEAPEDLAGKAYQRCRELLR